MVSPGTRPTGGTAERIHPLRGDSRSHWVTLPDGCTDWIWREKAITDLLTGHDAGHLFVVSPSSRVARQRVGSWS